MERLQSLRSVREALPSHERMLKVRKLCPAVWSVVGVTTGRGLNASSLQRNQSSE